MNFLIVFCKYPEFFPKIVLEIGNKKIPVVFAGIERKTLN